MCDHLVNMNLIFPRPATSHWLCGQVATVAPKHAFTISNTIFVRMVKAVAELFGDPPATVTRAFPHPALSEGSLSDCTFPEGFLLYFKTHIYPSACTVFSSIFMDFDDQKETYQQKFASSPSNTIPKCLAHVYCILAF